LKKVESFKRIVQLLLALVNIAGQVAIFAFCYLSFYSTWFLKPLYFYGHILFVLLYSAVIFAFSHIFGSLKIGYQRNVDLILSQVMASVIANALMWGMLSLMCYQPMNIVYYTPMTILQIIWASLWTFISNLVYKKIFPPRKILLVHGDRPIDSIVKKLSSRKDKFIIAKKMNASAGFETIMEEAVNGYDGVILWDVNTEERNILLKNCYGKSIRVYIMPKISDVILSGAEQLHIFDSPLLLTREYNMKIDQRFLKRLIDIVCSLILIVLTSPFMLITAILVKCGDGGPVLYKQTRCTINARQFKILKFRSMRLDAEKDGVARLAQKNDDRITPIGRFIRRVRLDELPQLFNILKGDMSFIGPRPERPEIIEKYMEAMPEFAYRMKVKAGLAGYAQVYGKYNTTPYDKLKLDLFYIEHYSVWLDIKLMFMTLRVLFTPDATEGVKDEQVTALLKDASEGIKEDE